MSRRAWTVGCVAAFAVGFGTAWLVKPKVSQLSVEDDSAAPARLRDQRMSGPSRTPSRDFPALISQMHEHRRGSEEIEKTLEELNPEEIPELLESLAKKAGMSGLDWRDRELFEEVLEHWYGESPEAAIAWVMALENPSDRTTMLQNLVELEAETDLEQALQLVEQFDAQQEGGLAIPWALMQKGVDHDVGMLLRLCKLGLKPDGGTSGSGCSYPSGFNFKGALEGLKKAKDEAPEGYDFSTLPSNLLSEWAKRDPNAALEWALQGNDLSFNSGLDEFFEGYAEVASDDDYGALVADLFDPTQSDYQKYNFAWDALVDKADEGAIRSFLDNSSTHGGKFELVGGLVVASLGSSGGDYDRTRGMLLAMLTADERVRLLQSEHRDRFRAGYAKRAMVPILERLGHTPAEIEALLPDVKGE